MKMSQLAVLPLLLVVVAAAPPALVCPESCKCSPTEGRETKAACMSAEFLEKLLPKHVAQIVELDLSELALKSVPPKLKKLKKLRKLDLTGNSIRDLTDFPNFPKLTHLSLKSNKIGKLSAKDLPNSLIQLDLSSNSIEEIEDLTKLVKLEKIDLNGNHLNCDCSFLKTRDSLLKRNVNFLYPTACSSPPNVKDVPLLHVYCVNNVVLYDDFLQNDDPDDGIEEGFVPSNVEISENSTQSEEDGSGSGDGLIDSPVPNCYFGCSTMEPIQPDESLPKANIPKEIYDAVIPGEHQTNPPPVTEDIIKEVAVTEQTVHEEVHKPVNVGRTLDSSHENIANPPKEVQEEPKKSTTTYIVLGCLLVVMLALVVYAVIKRRKRYNMRPAEEDADKFPPAEMKPLVSKPNAGEPTAEIQEKVPLMNGQNGHAENGETKKPGEDEKTEEVVLRPEAEEPTTPDATKRVTIKAKEYPSPKSPVMIQRRIDDDGRMVVTPSSPEGRA